MSFKVFSHNGQLEPIDKARVPLDWVEYSYGFGVYETIRYANGIIYFLDDHIERLMESARIIELDHEFLAEAVGRYVRELVAVEGAEACNLKVLLVGGATAADAQLFIMCLAPLFPDRKLYRSGVNVTTYAYERAFPHAKTLNMLQSYMAYRKAKRVEAYDALLIDRHGNVTEGTRTNFFGLRGSTIVSPPEKDILLGVTRKAMLKAALAEGFDLKHRDIALHELGDFDGCFITSTSTKILPIRAVDGRVMSEKPPAELRRLMKVFGDFLDESNGALN